MTDPMTLDLLLRLGRWVVIAALFGLTLLVLSRARGRVRRLGAAGFAIQALAALVLTVYSEVGLGAMTDPVVIFAFLVVTSVLAPVVGLVLLAVALVPEESAVR